MSMFAQAGAELTSTGNIHLAHIKWLQLRWYGLLMLLLEAEVHDGGRKQNYPRPQRRCTP